MSFDTDVIAKINSIICEIPNNTSAITVYHTGKNFLETTESSTTIKGTNFTVNEDGSITIEHTPSSTASFLFSTNNIRSSNFNSPLTNLFFTCFNELPKGIKIKARRIVVESGSTGTVTFTNPVNYELGSANRYSDFIIEVSTSYDGTPITIKPCVTTSNNQTVYTKGKHEEKTITLGNTYNSGTLDIITGKIISGSPEVVSYADDAIELNSFIGDNYISYDGPNRTNHIEYFETVGYKIEKEN
jgi:hypothetical protein